MRALRPRLHSHNWPESLSLSSMGPGQNLPVQTRRRLDHILQQLFGKEGKKSTRGVQSDGDDDGRRALWQQEEGEEEGKKGAVLAIHHHFQEVAHRITHARARARTRPGPTTVIPALSLKGSSSSLLRYERKKNDRLFAASDVFLCVSLFFFLSFSPSLSLFNLCAHVRACVRDNC